MATSVNKNKMSPGRDKKSDRDQHTVLSDASTSGNTGPIKQDPTPVLQAGEVFTYSSTADESTQLRFESFLTQAVEDYRLKLESETIGESATRPWSSEREGNAIYVTFPLTVNRGDQLAELLALLFSKCPSGVLVKGTTGWVEPTWSATASRHMLGIAAALQGAPLSFATSSSPVDITRVAVWHEACAIALSKPGGIRDARSSVLPETISGGKSASKYLSNMFATLRGCTSDEHALGAIATLERLIKLWCRSQGEEALNLIRRQKIPWSDVLHKGAPTERKKVRGRDVINIVTPLKPSRSPWLSGGERTVINQLYADVWSAPDLIRIEWNRLEATEQHSNYLEYVSRVRDAYAKMLTESQSINARLGHRKKWIQLAVEKAGTEPKDKKGKKDPFKWSLAFWKINLFTLDERVKRVFSPMHFLGTRYDTDNLYSWIRGHTHDWSISWDGITDYNPAPAKLLSLWVDRFHPNLSNDITIAEVENLGDENIFTVLDQAEA